MYPVSKDYEDKIQRLDRKFKLEIRVEHSKGTLILNDGDIAQGSLQYHEASQVGDEFTVGGVFASNIEFKIVNKDKYENIMFDGAKIYPVVYLLIKEHIDAHFMQPTQPSKMLDFEDVYEPVPLGVFNIDVADRLRSTINIKAIDNMIYLDRPYSVSKLNYPTSLGEIYHDICNISNVGAQTMFSDITNSEFIVQNRPSGDLTVRNVLSFVAELSGSFASFNRIGKLELKWYEDSGITITPDQRSQFKISDETMSITGIGIESDVKDDDGNDIMYVVGTDDYSINLSQNPLITIDDNYTLAFSNILNKIMLTKFSPYEASWNGDPSIQVGDKITHVDIDGVSHNTIVTQNDYKYRGTSIIMAKAKSNIVRGFKSSDNRIASIIKKIEEDFNVEISDLENAILNATNLIQNALGGHVVKREGELLIMDHPDIQLARKIWRWNLGGLGYTDGGIDGNFEVAMTMDGSINANFMTTGSMSAKIVQTGILKSKDGSISIDLDKGTFNFKDQMKWDSDRDKLTMGPKTELSWANVTSKPKIPTNVEINTMATNITKSTITTTFINALNVTAKNVNVDELSSISAKIGKVTSGDIVGARLRTSETGERIDITGDTLDVYGSGNHKVMSIAKVTSSQQDDRIILNDILGNKAGSIGIIKDWLTLNSGRSHVDIDGMNDEVAVSSRLLRVYGEFTASGTKAATIYTDNYGLRQLFATENPEVKFEDEGLAKLVDGECKIQMDPIFLESIELDSPDTPYIINLTPYDWLNLRVKEVKKDYFIIEEKDKLNGKFSWKLSATRKGCQGIRLTNVGDTEELIINNWEDEIDDTFVEVLDRDLNKMLNDDWGDILG